MTSTRIIIRKLLLVWLICLSLVTYSQFAYVEVDWPVSGTINHIASEQINMLPGYSYVPTGVDKMHAYINETAVFLPNYLTNAPDAEDRDPDYSLPVGSLPGSVSVSQSGVANYNIPIEVPPGTNGMQPNLSIVYNSFGGNGILGMKWHLAGLSAISRVPKDIYHDGSITGIQFNDEDKFALDGNRLMMMYNNPPGYNEYGGEGTQYHTEIETFAQITSHYTPGIGTTKFEVITKNGTNIEYGYTEDSQIEPVNRDEILLWLINKVTDPFGNYMEYFYIKDSEHGEYRVDRIEYTKNDLNGISNHYNTVQFYYDDREDESISYINDSYLTSSIILRKIKTFCENELVYEYKFYYHFDFYTHLVSIEKVAADELRYNPTIIEWGEESDDFFSDHPDIISLFGRTIIADFNNDGISQERFIQFYDSNCDPISSWELQSGIDSTVASGSNLPSDVKDILPGDFNGDGLLDLFIPYENTQDGLICIALFINNGASFNLIDQNISYSTSYDFIFKVGDFNGDGKTDIICARYNGSSTFYTVWDMNIATNSLEEIATHSEQDPIKEIFIKDFNGDGRDDFLFVYETYSSLRKYISNFLFELSEFTYLGQSEDIFPGDFNGDGNCDLLINFHGIWEVALCDGYSFNTGIIDSPQIINISYSSSSQDRYFISDLNFDGKDDIIEIIKASQTIDHNIYYYNGNDWNIESQTVNSNFLYNGFQMGDIDGDGSADLCSFNNFVSIADGEINCSGATQSVIKFTSFHAYEQRHRVEHISNGIDFQTDIVYKPLTDPEVYIKGNGAVFPLVDISAPIWVVHEVKVDNVLGDQNTIKYNYEGAKLHKQGRGFLGFSKVVRDNIASNIIQTTNYLINIDKYYPYLSNQKTEINYATPDLISNTTINDIEFKEFNTVFNCYSFLPVVKETETSDFSTTPNNINPVSSSINTITFDDYANPLTQTTIIKNGTTPEWQENTAFSNYVANGSLYPNKPESISKTKSNLSITGESLTQTNFTYNSTTGAVETIIVNPTDPLELSTSLQYNGFGNLVSTTSTAVGLNSRMNSSVYDDKGRFAIENTNAESHTGISVFDTKTGNLLSQTDPNNLTISNEYNSLGHITKTTSPTGQESNYTINWYNSSTIDNAVYYTTNNTDGNGIYQEYYNKTGQSLRKESIGFNGLLFVDLEYDDIGQLVQQSYPYYDGTIPGWITYTYNEIGRIETEITLTNEYSYEYDDLVTTKKETLLSLESETTTDAAGNVILVEEPNLNIIEYSFNNMGLTDEIVINGNVSTIVSMEYDILGNQTSLFDPDANLTSYSYNAFGELDSQTDANNVEYSFTKDNLGRIKTRSNLSGELTTYNYDNSSNGIGLISGIIYSNGIVTNYAYDEYSRMTSVSETIDGIPFVKGFSYNDYNQLVQETYPSGFITKNIYNSNGFLEQITKEDGSPLWECEGINRFGQITEFNLGNEQTTSRYYDSQGFISAIVTSDQVPSVIQGLDYVIDQSTGNLQSREDYVNYVSESFLYDDFHSKLISSQVGTDSPLSYTYDFTGNISSKTDAGTYTYDTPQIHAVTGISGNSGTIPSFEQIINYTGFNKVSSISEDDNLLEFTYGQDRLRRKTQKFSNLVLQESKYYMGNYEKVINEITGEVIEYNYISAPSGMFAVFTTSTGQNDKFQYIHTDYLGSVQSITDENGSTSEYSFDAWGRLRNPVNWSYNNLPNLPAFNRGFTGHEHLPEFGLINMNGRLYDPILGRMLSPDINVQMPSNSQNFNRYSYALNNPLKNIDPDGEFIIPILVGAALGAAFATSTYTISVAFSDGGLNNWDSGDFWKSAAYGAIGGAISGGIVSAGYSIGLATQTIAYQTMSNTVSNIVTSYAFYGNLESSDIYAGVIGGVVGGVVGNKASSFIFGRNKNIGGVIEGLISGGMGGLTSGFTSSYIKSGFKSPRQALYDGVTTGIVSATNGGVYGGIQALRYERNLLTGLRRGGNNNINCKLFRGGLATYKQNLYEEFARTFEVRWGATLGARQNTTPFTIIAWKYNANPYWMKMHWPNYLNNKGFIFMHNWKY